MYCKNCGAQMNDNAAVCVNCGAPKGAGTSYCPNCGSFDKTVLSGETCTVKEIHIPEG